ncbi:family 2A encapsulin nanocompartment shell protein [Lacipirellula sp.]|uniref:family 2A encapsulin nanocompartment shell protein n=1 Tax=Lacipirellula sp. TaxID=2691419 RepID=UPI003D0E0006
MSAPQLALDDQAARVLANATKTRAQLSNITPRWFSKLFPWVPVESGIYRVNKVRDASRVTVACSQRTQHDLPETFVDYAERPPEHLLSAVTTTVGVSSRVSALYNGAHDQLGEQLRLVTEILKERREDEILNNAEFGLLANAAPSQRIVASGPPTPDDLDRLISLVWKEPSFFVAHPRTIAAFGRECTRRRITLQTTPLFSGRFLTWRGIPLIPSNKLATVRDKSSIVLMRFGEERQGIVGLYQPNLPDERGRGLSVRFMEINRKAIASYLLTLYCSAAILTEDAIGVLEDADLTAYEA